jgi:hypothetical protein
LFVQKADLPPQPADHVLKLVRERVQPMSGMLGIGDQSARVTHRA